MKTPKSWTVLRLFSIGFAFVVGTISAFGEDFQNLPAKAQEAWVQEQIAKLDADTLRERSEAERALVAAGPDVLPLLPAPELLPSVAVRQAVRRIRLQLEEAKARESVKASLVSIQGTMRLKDILAKITKQTGNKIDADSLPMEILNRSREVEFAEVVFWKALDRLGDQFDFEIGRAKPAEGEAPAVRLVPEQPENEPAAVTVKEAFRMEALPLQLRPRFGVEGRQLLRVPMRVLAEPRLRPLFLKLVGKDFTARRAAGQQLDPFDPAASLELPLGEHGTETSFHMDFEVLKPFDGQSLQLAGKATLTVAAGSEEIEFRDLAKDQGAARRKGGVTVRLNEIEFQPDHKKAKFRITVHYDTGGPAFESHRTWMFHNRVYLEDAEGRRVERNADFHTALQTDGGVMVEYNFDGLSGDKTDYKFIYVAPTLIINVPVEFEFEKLPVPKED